jgi:hypothetical protein
MKGISMKTKVPESGLILSKDFLGGAEVVDIRIKNNDIVISPIIKRDPIYNLGKNPVELGISDASEYHDKYLYDSKS